MPELAKKPEKTQRPSGKFDFMYKLCIIDFQALNTDHHDMFFLINDFPKLNNNKIYSA
jgi:hypothetical protein